MEKTRIVLGMIAGVLIVISGLAHSLLGWKDIGAQLEAAKVPAELALGLKMGWQFGGTAMAAFGLMLVWLFNRRRKDKAVPMMPAALIAVTYTVFGAWALAISGDPFFAVFIVPGLLAAFATFWDSL